MSGLKEIEQAIERLSAEEFAQISRWINERDQDLWDAQLDADSAAGKLEFLFEEADAEGLRGELKEWPPRS